MTHTTHEFDRPADVRAALADPALVPELPAPDGGPAGASVAWLRATVARFCSGEPHRRRRALVEAELAGLEPAVLRRAAAAGPAEGDVRVRVVRALAEALGMPEPGAVAEAVTVVTGAYFGGADPAADEAVARLVTLLADEAGPEEAVANRIGLLVQACAATAALVEAAADDVPPARVLRETPPVRTMRRVAARATQVAGREIAEGDVVLLDLAAAQRAHPVPLTFGAPPRVCPGRAHALALADGLLGRQLTPFARLHHRMTTPLLLPNAWDVASAAALAARGFPAIGTTSLGIAAAAGLPDGAAATAEETVALARRLARGSFLFTVDIEGGFSEDPEQVADLARTLHDVGAAGINLEDGRPDGTLAPVELHAAKIAAVKSAAPALFVNARTDTHWLGRRRDETAARLAVYEQAGADGVFVPGLSDPEGIAALTAMLVTPLNILYTPTGPTLPELAALGVRRVSLGSLLYREALSAAVTTATAVRDGRPVDVTALSYAEVQALAVKR
ncbi:isocitrate lyase/phosphoenolpyruvate mutase family protein [Streptomyces litchfieldiae]|uniref:Isocitrate lyase/phosphoenolpyruvate mutase family protein n=1 Tax=Streptomyces litchfieldiae TaxID=3075543 RepID=A0ABU2MQV3_9ACTN|nr:isocitrate lyase/phosphoenolpyruvate mutase family protein [Streptomyces sp. DSM 44938]MDT0343469.1 isocitrate lyase/phosphoenolpyruvate mutase family protein [Streptomyces sp. DSM 44938]